MSDKENRNTHRGSTNRFSECYFPTPMCHRRTSQPGSEVIHLDVAIEIDLLSRRPITDPPRARETHLVVPVWLKIPLEKPRPSRKLHRPLNPLEAPLVGGSSQLGVNWWQALKVPASILLDERCLREADRAFGLAGKERRRETGLETRDHRWLLRVTAAKGLRGRVEVGRGAELDAGTKVVPAESPLSGRSPCKLWQPLVPANMGHGPYGLQLRDGGRYDLADASNRGEIRDGCLDRSS